MATDKVDIVNNALIMVGAKTITSFEDGSANAQKAAVIYDRVRQEVLYEFPWNFAKRRATLAPDTTTPEFNWENQFSVPPDFLRTLCLYPTDTEYKTENNKILVNDTVAYLEYISNVEDTTTFSPGFTSALIAKLAYEFSMSVVQNPQLTKMMFDTYRQRLREARHSDSTENTPVALYEVDEGPWFEARR